MQKTSILNEEVTKTENLKNTLKIVKNNINIEVMKLGGGSLKH